MRPRQRRVVRRAGELPGPIVVGGLGGSGTRVVEEILRQLNVDTGSDLNTAGDNRWFTFLCKLPRWDLDARTPDSPTMRSLAVLETAMTGCAEFTAHDRTLVTESFRRSRSWWRIDRLVDDRPPAWLRSRVTSLLRSRGGDAPGASAWGWKEPNSHLFIPHLQAHFGDRLRYVHVIRNGFDMAQSRNQLQLSRWGYRFGLADPWATSDRSAALDFWIRANEAAIDNGKALPTGSFFLLRYDDLCASPREEIARFVEFLDLRPTETVLRELVRVPQSGKARRRADCDLGLFGDDRVARVRALGFPAEQ
jgi:Sulfotransferase family